jgi:hypothetical protein
MTHNGAVRRTEFYFRSKYIDIQTTIYKLGDWDYLIYCNNADSEFETIRQDFNHSIKPISVPVDLTTTIPDNFIEIIPHITDKDISKNFEGVTMTQFDLLNILIGKFPNVYFYKVERGSKGIEIHTYSFKEKIGDTTYSRFLSTGDRDKIMQFLQGTKTPIDFDIIENEVEAPPLMQPSVHNPVQYIHANGFRRKDALEFSLRDEALYYDNVDKIFEGTFKKDNLYFYTPDEYSCYVDYTGFDNIDLRNHLFLFQTVYITLPYEKEIKTWLASKKIKEDEFLELVKRNRIKVILTQPEMRYDISFFKEIYKANPDGIITRRAITALHQIDLVEIADNYLMNDPQIIRELKPYCEAIGKATGSDPKYLFDMIAWPIRAMRSSFERVQRQGMIALPSYGINTILEKNISKAVGKDLELDFMVSSVPIHLANALNATYFPFQTSDGYSDYYFSNVMGDMLNFYRNATEAKLKDFIASKDQINSGVLPISPIDVIEINDYLPITELEDILSKSVIYPDSKRLMETLSKLSPEQRIAKINEYNKAVEEKLSKSGKHKNIIDLGTNAAMDTAGALTGFVPLGTAMSLVKLTGEGINKAFPELKNLNKKIEQSLYTDVDKANVHYLTKINRVARVKRFM